ncbi:MAG: hypothetical protein F7B59_04805 [Desulfurococcales archaeon]|nr:hypothetical protein [Desulfurococcales archaeon]
MGKKKPIQDKYIASTSWVESLSEELSIGKLEPTTEKEIPETRPKGLNAGKIIKQARENREDGITRVLRKQPLSRKTS